MRKTKMVTICAALAAVVVAGGVWFNGKEAADTDMPQLVSYVDSLDGSILIEADEVPLAAKPVVKTKTSTKKTVKRTKLKTKSPKSSTKTTTKTTVKNDTKTSKTQTVKTTTTTKTTEKTVLKKKSNIKTVTTTVKTTVKTTTTPVTKTTATKTTKTTANTTKAAKKTVSIKSIAPKAHANIVKAFETLNFSVLVDPSVNYSGKFDARAQLITVHTNSDEAIYHELGHFVAFLAGNADTKSEFVSIYKSEVSKFKGTRNNDAYIKSTAAEYFAESYQDYIERPSTLKSARPQTYKYIEQCVNKVTDSKVALIKQLYASQWK